MSVKPIIPGEGLREILRGRGDSQEPEVRGRSRSFHEQSSPLLIRDIRDLNTPENCEGSFEPLFSEDQQSFVGNASPVPANIAEEAGPADRASTHSPQAIAANAIMSTAFSHEINDDPFDLHEYEQHCEFVLSHPEHPLLYTVPERYRTIDLCARAMLINYENFRDIPANIRDRVCERVEELVDAHAVGSPQRIQYYRGNYLDLHDDLERALGHR